jgi:hypothetical protein
MFRITLMVLVGLAMLTVLLMPHNAVEAAPDMQTITLNTGFNQNAQVKYPLPSSGPVLDLFWTVTADPVSGAVPRSANVINKHAAWQPALADSQWISYVTNGSTGIKKGPYVYEKCFCLTKALFSNQDAIQKSSFDVSVRADDAFSLALNGQNLLSTGTGGIGAFNGTPATVTLKGSQLVQKLKPGRNCLTVRVDDIGTVITGFNLAGSLTTAGIDGIASGPKVTSQFTSCSTCRNPRLDVGHAIESLRSLSN